MKFDSLKAKIVRYLRNSPKEFVNGGELEILAQSLGFKSSNCSRRCRELVKAGILENRYVNGTVEYKLKVLTPLTFEEKESEQLELLKKAVM